MPQFPQRLSTRSFAASKSILLALEDQSPDMKRKAEDEEEGAAAAVDLDDGEADAPAKPAKVWDPKDLVDSRRCRSLKKGNPGSGPIVYW